MQIEYIIRLWDKKVIGGSIINHKDYGYRKSPVIRRESMDNLIEVQKKIIPQAIELMEKRYAILKQIELSQPIGRRLLSQTLDLSERTTRTEIDFLKEQRLINVAVSGMTITDEGLEILRKLDQVMLEVMGISNLESKLREKLGINFVAISNNVNDNEEEKLRGVAKCAANHLLSVLKAGDIVAIAGGTTMREVALSIDSSDKYNDVVVLPTRGSVGHDIDIQANSIAGLLARKLGSEVEFLYVPDEIDESVKDTILSIPDVKNTIEHLKVADRLIFSLGRADVMANRRSMNPDDIKKLMDNGAVGEAFGYYFNKDGEIVMKLNTVGIDLDMYRNIKDPILVFTGEDKVESFLALYKINKNISLITDELSAKKILEML